MGTLARAPGGQMREGATKAMSDIVEDPERNSGRAPLPRSGTARWFCARSSHSAPGTTCRSRLAGGLPLCGTAMCPCYFVTDP